MKNMVAIVLVFSLATSARAAVQAKEPHTNTHEHKFETCATPESSQCDLEYVEGTGWPPKKIPKDFPDRVVVGINFALRSGAAREISRRDLYHAHILVRKNVPWDLKNKDEITLLFHAQEVKRYPGFYERRNILLEPNGVPRILPCSLGRNTRPSYNDETICTVIAEDLEMDNLSYIFFVPVDTCSPEKLKKYADNIRVIEGHKFLFGVGGPLRQSQRQIEKRRRILEKGARVRKQLLRR